MAQRTVFVPDIGEVILAKRRGARNIRLTITASGKVRVGLPAWAPYASGISFAKSKTTWIQGQLAKHGLFLLESGDLIGKSHRLRYIYTPEVDRTVTRLVGREITIKSRLPLSSKLVQEAATKAAERALKAESEQLLLTRLDQLAKIHSYTYKDVTVRKLTSRWGSCSNAGSIRLSYYLVQLPWPLIDYVLLHELIHTKHLNHGVDFWSAFKTALPDARELQKQIRVHNPRVMAVKGVAQSVSLR